MLQHNPRCWHCTQPVAWRACVILDILLILALIAGPFRVIEAMAWVILVTTVAGANLGALARQVA